MLLSKRQSEIIRLFMQEKEAITVLQLARMFGVNKRTIQNDLNEIKAYFEIYDIEMEFSRKSGYRICGNDMAKAEALQGDQGRVEELSTAEKTGIAVVKLMEGTVNTYQTLADAIGVSRQTMINNFHEIEDLVHGFHLRISKEKGTGITLNGDELSIRNAFNQLLLSGHFDQSIWNKLDFCYGEPSMTIARQLISDVEKCLHIRFLEITLLEIEICFGLYRISKNKTISKASAETKKLYLTETFPLFKAYYKTVDLLPLPPLEKLYITSLLMRAKIKDGSKALDSNEDAIAMANYLMSRLEVLHPLKDYEKQKFIEGLTAHLSVAIYRIRNQIPIRNELLEQIKIMIPLLYEYTKVQLLECEKIYGLNFDENEIAYIAMYVASAYETSLKIQRTINILVVCSYGNTTSAILRSRLSQKLPDCKIYGPISKEELTPFKGLKEMDLVLTTSGIVNTEIQQICVNPLLNPEDIDRIQSTVSQLSYAKMCGEFLRKYGMMQVHTEISMRDLIDIQNIQIIDACDTWEGAIRMAAVPLLKKNLIEERYIRQMIQAVYRLGTYMVLIPETAFVHAGCDDGVKENCMSLLVLKRPVVFGASNTKIVRNIVVLGIKDKEATFMLDMVDILSKESNRRILASDKITKEIIINLRSGQRVA